MPDAAAARPPLSRALRETAVTALLAFGLFLPLIRFVAVQTFTNELVLQTRWPLLAVIVAVLAVLRFLHVFIVAPLMAERAVRMPRAMPTALPSALRSWTMPAVLGFVIVYPLLVMLI